MTQAAMPPEPSADPEVDPQRPQSPEQSSRAGKASALAEVTWRSGGYRGVNRAVLTSSVFSIWVIGNFLPFYIGRNAYLSQLADRFGTEHAQTLAGYMPGWLLPVLLLVSIVFGLLGGSLGRAVCAKHFVRAGLA